MSIDQQARRRGLSGTEETATPSGRSTKSYLFGPVVIQLRQEQGVWELTPHGLTLAEGMVKAQQALVGQSVLEVGVGSGAHSILALKLGARALDGTDIEERSLSLARENAARNSVAIRSLSLQNWLNFTPERKYDTLICNPPFCKSGTPDRRQFIKDLILQAPDFLHRGGHLLFVQSSMADFPKTERELGEAGFHFDVILQKQFLFRDYYFEEPGFIEESRQVPGGFKEVDGHLIEQLRVYWATRTS